MPLDIQPFLRSADEDLRGIFVNWEELPLRLEAAITKARALWPGVQVPPGRFADYVGERAICTATEPELPGFLPDLYLACACRDGNSQALAHFDRLLRDADPTLRRLGLPEDMVDDIRQEVREYLLVGSPKRPPAIDSYLGTGALAHWLRAVAGRRALAHLRRHKPTVDIENEILEDPKDPHLARLKVQHRAQFKEALHKAVAQLAARDRAILRALVIDDRSVEDVARLYQVHRVTASRWIGKIRKTLFYRTRAILRTNLQLSESELDSMFGLIESQMEMSLARALRSQPV